MNVSLTLIQSVLICCLAPLFSAFADGQQATGGSDHRQPPPAPKTATGFETVKSKDGTTITYEKQGDGPVLILVSGALSDRRSGAALAGMLAEHFTVINHDRRGRGDSGDTQSYAVEREVEDIAALIDAAGGKAALFGASSGAVLALDAAAKLPEKVTKAVLYEPPFVIDASRPAVPDDFADAMKKLVDDDRRGDAVEYFMTKGVGLPAEMVAQMRSAPMWPMMESLAHTLPYDGAVMGSTLSGKPLPTDRWQGVTAPVLVAVGGHSEPWLHNGSQALVEVVPTAEHRVLEGLDHAGPFMSPQSFVSLLREFIIDEASISEDVDQFFERYASALLDRDEKVIAEMYAVPSLILFPGKSIIIRNKRQTEEFFASSWSQYDGIDEVARKTVIMGEAPHSVWVDVTWSYGGKPRERFCYQINKGARGYQIAVLTPMEHGER